MAAGICAGGGIEVSVQATERRARTALCGTRGGADRGRHRARRPVRRTGLKRTSTCSARASIPSCRPATTPGRSRPSSAVRQQGRPVLEFRPADHDFDQIREVAYRPWADGTIPRRFCSGRALISDGQWRTVRYSIVEDGGMIGAKLGRAVVRGRRRPQLGLQPRLPGRGVPSRLATAGIRERPFGASVASSSASAFPADPVSFPFCS